VSFTILAVVAGVQFAFLGLLVAFIFVVRIKFRRRATALVAAQARVEPLVRDWLVGASDAQAVRDFLASLPATVARDVAVRLSQAALPDRRAAELAELVRDDPWFRAGVARSTSVLWWRRLEASRLLSELGTVAEESVVRALLRDPQPAVRIGASAALRRASSPALVEMVLEELPEQPLVVRSFQLGLLKDQWQVTQAALAPRLRRDASLLALPHWINVAESLALPDLLESVLRLHDHPAVGVRIAVARALRGYFHPATAGVLGRLLDDSDWRVRAQAARAFGVLGDPIAIPALAARLTDAAWWVRFRSALALSQLGEAGRRALRDARDLDDAFGSQMATMVSGLSPGSILELTEG
jgi:HEAT repeat protein